MDALIDMTTAANVFAFMQITSPTAAQQLQMENLVTQLSEWVSEYTMRQFGYEASIIERVRGFGGKRTRLRKFPIYTIAKINGNTITQTQSDDMLADYGVNGLVNNDCCRSYYTGCHIGTQVTRYVDTETRCMSFEYEAGFCMPNQTCPAYVRKLPSALTLALNAGVAKAFQNYNTNQAFGDVQSESLMSHSVSYKDAQANINYLVNPIGFFPLDSQIVINYYRAIPQW